jgi:hypothetical protein
VAASLRRDLQVDVELVDGHYGEFTVLVDGEEITSGGPLGFIGVLPSTRKVRALVQARAAGNVPLGPHTSAENVE